MTASEDPAGIAPSSPRRVVMLTFDGASSLDTVGPVDVLAGAQVAVRSPHPVYAVELVSLEGGLVRTSPAGVRIDTVALDALPDGPIDILLVAGGETAAEVAREARVRAAVRDLAERSGRVASICTGAFLLAEAGLLNRRKATTHWNWSEQLQRDYPEIDVDADRIFVQDGHVYSSAGITAGLDLALALVERDFGSRIALAVAQMWVMFLKRPGGQSQFSSFLPPSDAAADPILEILDWAQCHLDQELSVERMAEFCRMSPRTFARRFVERVGRTPSKYIEKLRVQAAKGYLESTDLPMDLIASATGFRSADRMRRSFNRALNVNPHEYRDRFRIRD
ncbi:GlxA family transcriptional regulator [Microbaculum marinum]|uniref:GlxA family transcriptional regulator n=1 Tax=Microbaculum marinum TaxID=1764581 RepID=A0AAW9RXZ7_9HYPH